MHSFIKEIEKQLKIKVINTKIKIQISNGDIVFGLDGIDSMGNIIQEWFGYWLKRNITKQIELRGTQTYPDFILPDQTYLEIKCYNADASPAFDLANFNSFVWDLTENPKRLDSYYLTFAYIKCDNGEYLIDKFYLRKIWQMTNIPKKGRSKGTISLQDKGGIAYNLRPCNFVSKNVETFNSRLEFLSQLKKAVKKYSKQIFTESWSNKYPQLNLDNENDWFKIVHSRYCKQTGSQL